MGQFAADITRFVQRTGLRADVVLRKLALDGLQGLLLKSPVDTGRFRGNWRVGINVVHDSEIDRNAKQGGLADEQATIATAKFGDTINITNNLPYAKRLEDGWSQQAPNGVLSLTFQELKSGFAGIAREVSL